MNRKLLIIFLLAAAAVLVLASCGKTKYNVDYHGQKDFFKGAKDAYAEVENVTLWLQQYELGTKDLSKASVSTVIVLSRALNCTIEELIDTG